MKPVQYAVWDCLDDSIIYYSCPLKFITEEIIEWYKEYSYNKKYRCMNRYMDESNKSVLAEEIYTKYLKLFNSEEANRSKNESLTNTTLMNLRR
jgi:hypothetical protein